MPDGYRKAYTRRDGTRVRRTGIDPRKKRKRSGSSRKAMTGGQWNRRKANKHGVMFVAWSSTGTASFMFFQQQRYTACAVFGILSVLFGVAHAGVAIHRAVQNHRAPRPVRRSAGTATPTRAPRPSARQRTRRTLENGVGQAAARKPALADSYQQTATERRASQAQREENERNRAHFNATHDEFGRRKAAKPVHLE